VVEVPNASLAGRVALRGAPEVDAERLVFESDEVALVEIFGGE
jgi:hypothetical protein